MFSVVIGGKIFKHQENIPSIVCQWMENSAVSMGRNNARDLMVGRREGCPNVSGKCVPQCTVGRKMLWCQWLLGGKMPQPLVSL